MMIDIITFFRKMTYLEIPSIANFLFVLLCVTISDFLTLLFLAGVLSSCAAFDFKDLDLKLAVGVSSLENTVGFLSTENVVGVIGSVRTAIAGGSEHNLF